MTAETRETVCVYALGLPSGKRTYVGVTNDFVRRLRQHNGDIVGGARYTKNRPPAISWEPLFTVWGLPGREEALQLEYRLHHPEPRHADLDRRIARGKDLDAAMARKRWTSRAPLLRKLLPTLCIRWNKTLAKPPRTLRRLVRVRMSSPSRMHRRLSPRANKTAS